VPSWNPISISGYHIREAGSTAVQEIAFTFANAVEYVKTAIAAGLRVDEFAPRLSFFFAAHNDLFEEVAKFRAARRIYARFMRERFGASDASARLRFHTQTGGVTLQAQQPLNNVVRVTVQALSAVLGGTQSLHTNGYDEALALPTAEAATLALRTQQVIAYESGATQTADPLAGSYYVESLTSEVEARALALMERVEEIGGAAAAIEAGFFQEEIGRSAYEQQLRIESGQTVVVGVNKFSDAAEPLKIATPDFSALEREQAARLRKVKATRDNGAVKKTLAALVEAGRNYAPAASPVSTAGSAARREPLMPLIIDAVRARASVGEIADALAKDWGHYTPGR
jgi:methylmalonyl-CoA mutase N-terminal domain/subunit